MSAYIDKDKFDSWMAEQGEPATRLVEGFEVVEPKPQAVKVGDFFYSSWGYDQTNVDFYEVVGVTPSGKSVKVKEVRQEVSSNGGPSDRVVPIPGAFTRPEAEPATKRLRFYSDRPSFFVASYADAYLWDGMPKHQTGANWGH